MKRVKATYYIEPEHLNVLEAERIHRINAGVARSECSVSALVNEAIKRLGLQDTPSAASSVASAIKSSH